MVGIVHCLWYYHILRTKRNPNVVQFRSFDTRGYSLNKDKPQSRSDPYIFTDIQNLKYIECRL